MNQTQSQNPTNALLVAQLSRKIHGIMYTQLIFAAAKLGIADLLKDGPMPVDELAAATGTLTPRLYRIMQALASLGIFVEKEPRHFALTPLGKLLQTDDRDSFRSFAIMLGSEWHIRAWSNILHCLRTEESAFEDIFGMNMFEYFQQHPVDSAVFNDAMTSVSKKQAVAVCDAYDFSGFHTIIDVGGGHGLLLTTILKTYPSPRGVLFELPSVAEVARTSIRNEKLSTRCQVVEGSFFSDLPRGGDVYVLKYIIHDWDDDRAIKILKNCRDAMGPKSRMLVVDIVIPTGDISFTKRLADSEMLVLTPNGRERTESEFQDLFSGAGFKLTRIIPTKSELDIVEGVPV